MVKTKHYSHGPEGIKMDLLKVAVAVKNPVYKKQTFKKRMTY